MPQLDDPNLCQTVSRMLETFGTHPGAPSGSTSRSTTSARAGRDLLKIDQSFVAGLTGESRSAHMVRTTISMAHGMGMQAVAEGVETPEQLEFLAGLECDLAQGFLFAGPLPAAER